MFRKLKLQFILTNLVIITSLFVSLTIGAYLLLQINMINHAKFFAERMAEGINSGMLPESFPDLNRQPRFEAKENKQDLGPLKPLGLPPVMPLEEGRPKIFYVKTDFNGKIFLKSSKLSLSNSQLNEFLKQIVENNKMSGIINLLHSNYFFYKTPLPKELGILVIFQDLKRDKNIQQSLVISLSIIGVIYLVLSTLGSLFMANRAIKPIQNAWKQQKDFLADASHELRTPLAVIQTNLEVIISNSEETVANQKDWLTNIQEELQQMTGLVSSLLFLARVDSHQTVMEKEFFSIDKLVIRTSEAFKPLASSQGIDFSLAIPERIVYCGDELYIRRVLEILLDNAIRHTPVGGKIAIALNQTDKELIMSVSDTGEGITKEHIDKIFDRFYQVDVSRSNGKAGLGLSIAKSIIEKHGGKIVVDSQPKEGTIFTIHLPLQKGKSIGSESREAEKYHL